MDDPATQTTEFKMCRDGRTTATRGTIERWEEGTDRQRECVFTITVPHHLDIQISCSNVSLVTPGSSLQIQGVNGPLFANPPIANFGVHFEHQQHLPDFTMRKQQRLFQMRLEDFYGRFDELFQTDERTTSSNGTIQPLSDKKTRECYFTIDAPPDRFIQISCSTVSLTNPGSYLSFHGISDVNVLKPVVNRLYTSSSNSIHLNSQLEKEDWFECKWDTVPVPSTTDFKLCRHGQTSSSTETIQPLIDEEVKEPRKCFFGVSDGDVTQPTVNKIYTLRDTGVLHLYSRFTNEDWFSCSWTTIQEGTTTTSTALATTTESQSPLFKLCRDKEVYSSSGILQPNLVNLTTGELGFCQITINAPVDELMQISCSVINLKTSGSYLKIFQISDLNAEPPVLNRKYFSDINSMCMPGLARKIGFNTNGFRGIHHFNATDFKFCQQGTTQ